MGVSSEFMACLRNKRLSSYRRPSVKADAWVRGFSGTSLLDEATQLFYEYRIHPLELDQERSGSCSALPRKPGTFLTFGSWLRSYPGGVWRPESATPPLESPASAGSYGSSSGCYRNFARSRDGISSRYFFGSCHERAKAHQPYCICQQRHHQRGPASSYD